MIRKTIKIGGISVETYLIALPRANLILAVAPNGYVMCGYLDISAAEKLGDAACVVSGVKDVEELLAKPVVKLTSRAEKLGIKINMPGAQALALMA